MKISIIPLIPVRAVFLSSTCRTAVHRCHVSPRCRGGRAKWGRTPQTSKPLHVVCAAVAESCTGHIVHHRCALCAQALAVLVKGQRVFLYFVFFIFRFLGSVAFWHPRLSPKSGGTLSVAQRDSAVSDYKPCAEEQPAQSASQWGKNSTQGRESTEESLQTEEFYGARLSDKKRSRSEDISSSARLYLILLLCLSTSLFSPGQDTQLRSLLDDRELGTSLGKTKSSNSRYILLRFCGGCCDSDISHASVDIPNLNTRYFSPSKQIWSSCYAAHFAVTPGAKACLNKLLNGNMLVSVTVHKCANPKAWNVNTQFQKFCHLLCDVRPLGGAGRVQAAPHPGELSAHFCILQIPFFFQSFFPTIDDSSFTRATL